MKRFSPKKRAKQNRVFDAQRASTKVMIERAEELLADSNADNLAKQIAVCLEIIENFRELSQDPKGEIPEHVVGIEMLRTVRYILKTHVVTTIDGILREMAVGPDDPEKSP
ncbi:MAG TPA: hypothetical protein VE967_19370 [Gemmatimonadaceae bacterium]|nr:hypothetical protein [Gemmatimonadaceae bacterium]